MTKKKKSKGERLGWLHIKDMNPIVLTADMLKGIEVIEPRCKCGECFLCKNVKFIE